MGFTKEKWQIKTISNEQKLHNGHSIRDEYGVPVCYGVSQYNARFIVAAPKLLAACKEVVSTITPSKLKGTVRENFSEQVALSQLSKAIANAEAS